VQKLTLGTTELFEDATDAFLGVDCLLAEASDGQVTLMGSSDRMAADMAEGSSFHRVMVDSCGNPEIGHVLDRLEPRVRRLELLSPGPLPGRRSLAQHEAIIARAVARDGMRAASATRENWLELGAMIQRSLTG